MEIFTEKQQFRQWWIWLLMSPLLIGTLYLITEQLILGNPIGDKPLTDTGVVLFALFAFAIVFFLWSLQLKTRVDSHGITMHYRPILKRQYTWEAIKNVEIIDYGFVGYGFRWWPKHGWIYNVGGSMGMKLYLKSGKHFTIGTQKHEELQSVLQKLQVNTL